MSNQVIELYRAVLTTLGYEVDDEDAVSSIMPDGSLQRATIDGKQLALPTQKWLRNGFGDDYLAFHPLSETTYFKGTSPVLRYLQRKATADIGASTGILAESLLKISADQTLHKAIPAKISKFLISLKEADEKAVTTFNRLITAAIKKNSWVNVHLKYDTSVDGEKVNRACVIYTPVLSMLENTTENTIFGVKVTPAQRKLFAKLIRLILPEDKYEYGSLNRTAPYFHAFLQAYDAVTRDLNEALAKYKPVIAQELRHFTPLDMDLIGDFASLSGKIPALAGNEGAASEKEPAPAEAPKPQSNIAMQATQQATQPVVQTAQQRQQQPVAAPQVQQPAQAKATVTMAELMKQQPIAQPQMMPQQMMVNQFGQPVMMQQGMMMPQQVVQQPVQQAPNPFAMAVATATGQVPLQQQHQMGMQQNTPMGNLMSIYQRNAQQQQMMPQAQMMQQGMMPQIQGNPQMMQNLFPPQRTVVNQFGQPVIQNFVGVDQMGQPVYQ